MSSSGVGTKSATPDLVRAPGAGHDRERPAVARRGVAPGRLAGVRPAPVERLVRHVADRRERHEPPADDPVGDLEAAAHVDRPAGAVRERELVARERLAGGQHPAHRVAGEAVAAGIAPAVGEVGDDDVARPTMTAQVDRQLVVGQDPAPARGARTQLERQAAEDRRAVGQPREGRAHTAGGSGRSRRRRRRSTTRKGRPDGPVESRDRARPVVMAASPPTAISRRC